MISEPVSHFDTGFYHIGLWIKSQECPAGSRNTGIEILYKKLEGWFNGRVAPDFIIIVGEQYVIYKIKLHPKVFIDVKHIGGRQANEKPGLFRMIPSKPGKHIFLVCARSYSPIKTMITKTNHIPFISYCKIGIGVCIVVRAPSFEVIIQLYE